MKRKLNKYEYSLLIGLLQSTVKSYENHGEVFNCVYSKKLAEVYKHILKIV
jgi:hypothetical protein